MACLCAGVIGPGDLAVARFVAGAFFLARSFGTASLEPRPLARGVLGGIGNLLGTTGHSHCRTRCEDRQSHSVTTPIQSAQARGVPESQRASSTASPRSQAAFRCSQIDGDTREERSYLDVDVLSRRPNGKRIPR